MKILRVKVRNFGQIREVEFTPGDHYLFLLGGKNRAGKTSLCKAIIHAIQGKTAYESTCPIRKGEDEANIEVELTGFSPDTHKDYLKVCRKLTRKGDSYKDELLIYESEDKEGFTASAPQSLLNKLFETRGFDPYTFKDKSTKEQVEIVKQLVGIDFDAIDDKIERLSGERKLKNQELKKAEAVFESMPLHKDAGFEEKSASDVLLQIQQLQAILPTIQAAESELEKIQLRIDNGTEHSRRLLGEMESHHSDIKGWQEEIAKLQEKIDGRQKDLAKCRQDITKFEEKIGELRDQRVAKSVELNELREKYDADKVQKLQESVKTIDATNKKVRQNIERREKQAEVRKLNNEWSKLDEEIKKEEASKTEAIESAQWPVEGISFTSAGVTYNGIPLAECSTSEQLIISLAISAKLNPSLRLLIIQRGESLDDDSLGIIKSFAEKNDFQVLVEYVCSSQEDEERCQVVLECGEIKKKHLEEEAKADGDTVQDNG